MQILSLSQGDRFRSRLGRAVADMARNLQSREFSTIDKIVRLEGHEAGLRDLTGANHLGFWHCELADETITWTSGVYDLFDLPHGMGITRSEALGFYTEQSRKLLENVRSRAIRTCDGFELDTAIVTALGNYRWIRIHAFVERDADRPVRIFGIKRDVTDEIGLRAL